MKCDEIMYQWNMDDVEPYQMDYGIMEHTHTHTYIYTYTDQFDLGRF